MEPVDDQRWRPILWSWLHLSCTRTGTPTRLWTWLSCLCRRHDWRSSGLTFLDALSEGCAVCENMMTQDMRSAPSAAYNHPRCAVYLANNNIAIYRFFFLPLASGFTVWTYAGQFIFIPSAATRLRKHQYVTWGRQHIKSFKRNGKSKTKRLWGMVA